MRYGFTTGSCAAAAAKAATYMLLTGKKREEITIQTPKGIDFCAQILQISRKERSVSCGVRKDGGDDPDVTTGAMILADVQMTNSGTIQIDGGVGVGRVTRPGLDQPVGSAAINHVPREMILREVEEVRTITDDKCGLLITISVPGGEALAEKTFNPRLGIQGGISILGTSGIVEPMSSQALLDTIQVELRQQKAMGHSNVAVSPGNYGQDYLWNTYHFDLDQSVKSSNFIGDTIEMAAELGFQGMLLTGHIGKLIKVSGGIMNTHSKEGDCRMELLTAAVIRAGGSGDWLSQILDCVTTQEALNLIEEKKLLKPAMEQVMEKVLFYLERKAAGRIHIECMIYDNEHGELARTRGALNMLNQLKEEK